MKIAYYSLLVIIFILGAQADPFRRRTFNLRRIFHHHVRKCSCQINHARNQRVRVQCTKRKNMLCQHARSTPSCRIKSPTLRGYCKLPPCIQTQNPF